MSKQLSTPDYSNQIIKNKTNELFSMRLKILKFLRYTCRNITKDGYVSIYQIAKYFKLSVNECKNIIIQSEIEYGKRFELTDTKVRALWGHSIKFINESLILPTYHPKLNDKGYLIISKSFKDNNCTETEIKPNGDQNCIFINLNQTWETEIKSGKVTYILDVYKYAQFNNKIYLSFTEDKKFLCIRAESISSYFFTIQTYKEDDNKNLLLNNCLSNNSKSKEFDSFTSTVIMDIVLGNRKYWKNIMDKVLEQVKEVSYVILRDDFIYEKDEDEYIDIKEEENIKEEDMRFIFYNKSDCIKVIRYLRENEGINSYILTKKRPTGKIGNLHEFKIYLSNHLLEL